MMQMFSGASSGAWFEKAQRFGKSFMLPIAVLPAAGLLLGIGGALSNPNTLTAYPFLDVDWLQAIFTIMTSAGSIVFANLSVLFAVGSRTGENGQRHRRACCIAGISGDERHHQRFIDTQRNAGARESRCRRPGDDAGYSDAGNRRIWWGGDWACHLRAA